MYVSYYRNVIMCNRIEVKDSLRISKVSINANNVVEKVIYGQ